jgi:hypothetical protein
MVQTDKVLEFDKIDVKNVNEGGLRKRGNIGKFETSGF